MINKTKIGGGTLKEFQADYAEVEMLKQRITAVKMASQIFPVFSGVNGGVSTMNSNNEILYEWIIYFAIDETIGKQINKESGKVETIMTEKEGRQMDKDVKDIRNVSHSSTSLNGREQVGEPDLVMEV